MARMKSKEKKGGKSGKKGGSGEGGSKKECSGTSVKKIRKFGQCKPGKKGKDQCRKFCSKHFSSFLVKASCSHAGGGSHEANDHRSKRSGEKGKGGPGRKCQCWVCDDGSDAASGGKRKEGESLRTCV